MVEGWDNPWQGIVDESEKGECRNEDEIVYALRDRSIFRVDSDIDFDMLVLKFDDYHRRNGLTI
jgi:hypothetical protein